MARYKAIHLSSINNSFNKLSFVIRKTKTGLSPKLLINALFTKDERVRFARRIEIASMLTNGKTYQEIIDELKVGSTTVALVDRKMAAYPEAFLVMLADFNKKPARSKKKKRRHGSSKLIFKKYS